MNQADLRATPWQLSERARKLTSSAIREILKVTERPEVISFAGGLSSPATFPVEEMHHASERILRDKPSAALQYSTTESFMLLREWIAARYSAGGVTIRPTQVCSSRPARSRHSIWLGKVLVDPGSRVLVETPTYLGALQSFSLFEPNYVQVPTDESGLIPEGLDTTLTANARLLYAQPDFQNPTGCRLPLERLRALAAIAQNASFPILEDEIPTTRSITSAPRCRRSCRCRPINHIVHIGSFSKRLVLEGARAQVISSRPKSSTSNSCRPSRQPICTHRASRSASSTKW